jgi:hypothetical protein
MSNIVARRSAQVVQPDPILNAQLAEAQRQNLVAAARVQGGQLVASVAMQGAVTLSHAADVAFKTSPLGEDQYRAIVMAYGTYAVSEIQRLSLYSGGQR